jgi:two-component system, response regulator YesN
VVLVEDETYLRKELALTTPWANLGLALAGEAGDGLEGERLITSVQPDIVLTDIRLPGQDGLAMLERALPRHAIIFSGHSDAPLMQQAIRIGVDDYLFKPVDDEELVRALRKVAAMLDAEGPAAGHAAGRAGDHAAGRIASPRSSLPPLQRRFGLRRVDDAVAFIEKNYQNAVGLSETAGALGLSEDYLSRLFHKTTGQPFLAYVTRLRIARALDLMEDPRLNITEIYTRCGFRTGSHFAQVFRGFMGESPARYRNRARRP